MRGLSFTICFGGYGGFYVIFSRSEWRLCLGWVAFTIYFVDLEAFILNLKRKYRIYKDYAEEKDREIYDLRGGGEDTQKPA